MFIFKRKTFVWLVTGSILLLFFSSLIPAVRTPALDILSFPLNLSALIQREIAGIIFYHRNFIENERLNKEINLLKQKINTLNEVSLENKRLSQLVSFKQKAPYKVIAARVIAHSPDNWSSAVVIDKGQYNGIKHGMVVIGYLGLAGRVIETTRRTSKVMLINDPNFAVSAIDQRSRQEGLVSGALGNSLVMKYLSRDCDIQAGDTIITSGFTDRFPKGLLIGMVYEVGREFSGLNSYAMIKPAVKLDALEEVLVIVL